jgi:hypothetical protein
MSISLKISMNYLKIHQPVINSSLDMSSKTHLSLKKCALCEVRLDSPKYKRKRRVHCVSKQELIAILKKIAKGKEIISGELVCSKCISYAKFLHQKDKTLEAESETFVIEDDYQFSEDPDKNQKAEPIAQELNQVSPEFEFVLKESSRSGSDDEGNKPIQKKLSLNMPRVSISHKSCVICKQSYKKLRSVKLVCLTEEAIVDIYIQVGIYIPKGTRCCPAHLNEQFLIEPHEFSKLESYRNTSELNKENIQFLLHSLKYRIKNCSLLASFKNKISLSNEICLRTTGLDKNQFFQLCCDLKSMRSSEIRSKPQALAVYLFWLRTGLNQIAIADHFGIDQQDVSRYCKQVRNDLKKEFVEENVGAKHKDRIEWLKHNTIFVEEFFTNYENKMVFIADGTYCYCEKSANNYFQRKSYSLQKKRHLVKPFIICTADGLIVDVYGLFEATKNDATILKHIFDTDQDLLSLIKSGDIFLVDRGFRDCVEDLQNKYFIELKIPSSILDKQKQLETIEANKTRLITKCRWVIEAINRFFKETFRALGEVKNDSLCHTFEDYKIASAIINKFYRRMFSDGDNAKEMAIEMKKKLFCDNELKSFVEINAFHKKSLFDKIDASKVDDFPNLPLELLKKRITFGSYQLKQSLSYLAEHLNNNGKYEILINRQNSILGSSKIIQANIQSRHSNAVKYKVYIKYSLERRDCESIEGWYCTCKNGARTVGCCSHIASIIYYLSYGKNQDSIPEPAGALCLLFNNTLKTDEEEDAISQPVQDKPLIENKPIKRDLSFQVEQKLKKRTVFSSQNSRSFNLRSFLSHVPNWGGKMIVDGKETSTRIINTCTIDYLLLCLWVSSQVSSTFVFRLSQFNDKNRDVLIAIINLIDNEQWNEAKSMWIIKVLNMRLNEKESVSTYGSEYDMFISRVVGFQMYQLNKNCKCKRKKYKMGSLYFARNSEEVTISLFENECRECGSEDFKEYVFTSTPAFLIVENLFNIPIMNTDIPRFFELKGVKYSLLCATFHDIDHYRAIFLLNNRFYLVDDLKPTNFKDKLPSHCISSSFYIIAE